MSPEEMKEVLLGGEPEQLAQALLSDFVRLTGRVPRPVDVAVIAQGLEAVARKLREIGGAGG